MDRSLFRRVGDVVWELGREHRSDMNVPIRILADETLLEAIARDHSVEQLVNVSTLPGVSRFAIGMPDMHEGYGFPVGGVAAMEVPEGAISPGGIGFDINCGVRLLTSRIRRDEVGSIEPLVHELSRAIPVGYGRGGRLELDDEAMTRVLAEGCPYVVRELGLGRPEDLDAIESRGALPGADPTRVSERARVRGSDQLGTLGGGNHFLEVQVVERVFDEATAEAFGIFEGQLTVMLHTGSRGLGHQVCTDAVRRMDEALHRRGIVLVDRQLAHAPLSSPEGEAYFAAMCAAANFAWSNRQVLTHRARETLQRILGTRFDPRLDVVYDVAHNVAKIERFGGRRWCIHRKGATRAFGPGNPELPERYRATGQPVLIPGSMGTASYVLAGEASSADVSFASACHGAGRAMSRGAAKRLVKGSELRRELESRGIVVRCPSNGELAEEAPVAYKDVDRVVDVVVRAGVARKVARCVPIGILKG